MWFYRNVNTHDEDKDDDSKPPRWIRPFVKFQSGFEHGFERLRANYRALLATCFEHRKPFATFFLVFCAGSWLLTSTLGRDFFPAVDAGQFLLHLRARTGTRIEETQRLADQVNEVIRKEIPAEELGGILDNIGIPNSSINLSYNNSGVIGPGDADILVSAQTRPCADGKICAPVARAFEPRISRHDVLFSAGGHREPDVEFRPARAV